MSLLSIAKKIKEDGFDPRKDSVNGPAALPAGDYTVVLKRVQFNIAPSGWESLGFTFEVREEGEFNGRTEYVSFGTLSEWNGKDISWSVERTIKFFTKAIELAGDKVMKNDFEDGRALADALERKAVGSYFTLKILETKGKEDKVYRNYDIEELPQVQNGFDIDEDDLPF
ncbi:hypothetical protein [uncultured Granulicatella sp.]|uniref:hypothetical protein n=1 Tax=uncultured Granulicatella sp. TaxID=316089 RepID=UPI002065DD27|nr:hypothetical protein [uncultured Granulicatella sp.]DAQ06904.1 MAG TPA: Protein of unknown function (DUF669) [Caudoviricetes sp.]